jgi:hypothetical protein
MPSADDMHGLIVAPGNRDLDPVDKAQPNFIRRRPRFGKPTEFVVIGQRQQFDTVFPGAANHDRKAPAGHRRPSNGNAGRH